MPDISIQFHALPAAELLPFIKDVVNEFELFMVAMRFHPFEAVSVDEASLDELFSTSSPYRRLALTLGRPVLPVAHELDFAKKNPDHLRLEIGKQTECGLEQSWLTARTNNEGAFSAWKKIAKRLEDVTQKGVMAINATTGATAPVRSFRYTRGAKELEAAGIAMLPPQGPNGPRLRLGLIAGAAGHKGGG